MILTDMQIQELTIGAISIVKDASGFSFLRFTPEQKAAFGAVFDMWAIRSDYTSGIRIEFHTDATSLSVIVASDGCYEVLVDDLCCYCETIHSDNEISMLLDGKDHKITIVLPNLSCGKIRHVRLNGESYVHPHTYRKKVAFYGDSITQGSTAAKNSQCYTWLLTRYFDLHSINFGVGGIRFQPETVIDVGYDPDVVFIALGTNNYGAGKPKELFHQNCSAYFDNISALYPQAHIICITPIWRADGDEVKPVGTIHDARDYIQEEAAKRGFTIIDGFSLVPHRVEYFEDSRLHPNDIGFAQYALNIAKAVGQYL